MSRARHLQRDLDPNPLNFLLLDDLLPSVVELRSGRRDMSSDVLSRLQHAPFVQIGCDTRPAEGVAGHLVGGEARTLTRALHHLQDDVGKNPSAWK